jgi:hypothetical protein
MLWRQGDVFIAKVRGIPEDARARRLVNLTLVHGEATGHSHRIEANGSAALFVGQDCIFLDVTAPTARVIHEEHGPITLERGAYRVWRQREYTPQRIVRVVD